MSKSLNLIPKVNEKTYELAKDHAVYVFDVDASANKLQIIKAVKDQFDVEVKSVNLMLNKGKPKRTLSISGKRSVNRVGYRPARKKAYVSLKAGQSLPFFESVDEAEEKREANQEKFDKAFTKQTEKESKVKTVDSGSKRRFLRTKRPEGSK